MRRSITRIDNETDKGEATDGKHPNEREPKLALTEGAGSQKVDCEGDDTRNCDPHGIVELGAAFCDCS